MASNYSDTHLSELQSAVHGRERREERDIQKIDCMRARRYGMREPAKKGRIKYTYGGVVFIYDQIRNREITCYPTSDKSSTKSGTKLVVPTLLPKMKEVDNLQSRKAHENLKAIIRPDLKRWTSHTVLVVDMSGSMRTDDVNGARCRSDGVFMAIAKDFIKTRLEDKTATTYDLVSVVVMRDDAQAVLQYEPTDWVLYNTMVDLREWTVCRPRGPGNYMPALEMADTLLQENNLGSCALALTFFSDGKPSDQGNFVRKMGDMASKYGRRLTVSCIGMADPGTDFGTLQSMVAEASAYGSVASFNKPSLDANSLSVIFSTLSTSLTTSKTEMTDVKSGTTRTVRTDVTRERKGAVNDLELNDTWDVYTSTGEIGYVSGFWSWSMQKNDMIQLYDPRCCYCFKQCVDMTNTHLLPVTKGTVTSGQICKKCNVVSCTRCQSEHPRWRFIHPNSCVAAESGRSNKTVPSFAVAIKIPVFGEGAERVVRKCRFLDSNMNFTGPMFVAKESRFVEKEHSNYDARMDYHKEFMRTQNISYEISKAFNKALDSLVNSFSTSHHDWIAEHPRVEFLDPMVVEVRDDANEEYNILIEPYLEGEYTKFNNNMGYVQGRRLTQSDKDALDLANRMAELRLDQAKRNLATNRFAARNHGRDGGRNGARGGGLLDLGAIAEGSEDEDSDDSDDDDEDGVGALVRGVFKNREMGPAGGSYSKNIPDADFPQAFSHFSFEHSKRNLIVVDLQGVLEVKKNGKKTFRLTDPVVHKRREKKGGRVRKWNFGRTDRHEKGMRAFFQTHTCTDACRLLGLSKVNVADI